MLLQALYDHARRNNLLDSLPYEDRWVRFLLPISWQGVVSDPVELSTEEEDQKGELSTRPGRLYAKMPRYMGGDDDFGDKNGSQAHYLVEALWRVLGLNCETAKPLTNTKKDRLQLMSHEHFWRQIEGAYKRTNDKRLATLLTFRDRYCRQEFAFIANSATGAMTLTADGGSIPWAKKAAEELATFEIAGEFVFPPNADDPLRRDWEQYCSQKVLGEDDNTVGSNGRRVCLVTGEITAHVARLHRPKVRLPIPGHEKNPGGLLTSFHAVPYTAFGLKSGDNAPVSVRAAVSCALALQKLARDPDTRFTIGNTVLCFWAREDSQAVVELGRAMLGSPARPIRELFNNPWKGSPTSVRNCDRFYSVALTGSRGRIAIRHWVDLPLEMATANLARWFDDLDIAGLRRGQGNPYRLKRLALALARDAKELNKRSGGEEELLYRAAVEGVSLPNEFLVKAVREFSSALRAQKAKEGGSHLEPYDVARFALIKLILRRRGCFMATAHLSETDDVPYNLGRLLAVLDRVRRKSKDWKDRGVIKAYFGAAAANPAAVFPRLIQTAQHHLGKLSGSSDEHELSIAHARISLEKGGFPKHLSPEQQARFALGVYQQKAFDDITGYVRGRIRKLQKVVKKGDKATPQELEESLTKLMQMQQKAEHGGYTTLAEEARRELEKHEARTV